MLAYLRQDNYSGIGATTDNAFAFPRKFKENSLQSGWYRWTQQGLAGTTEPLRSDGLPEYAHYLAQNGADDEFPANTEVMARFFDGQGKRKSSLIEQLRHNIALLL